MVLKRNTLTERGNREKFLTIFMDMCPESNSDIILLCAGLVETCGLEGFDFLELFHGQPRLMPRWPYWRSPGKSHFWIEHLSLLYFNVYFREFDLSWINEGISESGTRAL